MRCAAVFLARLQVPQSRLPRHVTAFLGTMPPQTVHFLPLGGKCLQRHTDNVDSLTAYFAPSSIRLISAASYSRRIASLSSTENFETIGALILFSLVICRPSRNPKACPLTHQPRHSDP